VAFGGVSADHESLRTIKYINFNEPI